MKIYIANSETTTNVECQNDDHERRYLLDEARPRFNVVSLNSPEDGQWLVQLQKDVLEAEIEWLDDGEGTPELTWICREAGAQDEWKYWLVNQDQDVNPEEPDALDLIAAIVVHAVEPTP